MKCVCFANLCVFFRHNLDEAMLTDPWDSMKHADLGGFSTFLIKPIPFLPQVPSCGIWVFAGSTGSPGSVNKGGRVEKRYGILS